MTIRNSIALSSIAFMSIVLPLGWPAAQAAENVDVGETFEAYALKASDRLVGVDLIRVSKVLFNMPGVPEVNEFYQVVDLIIANGQDQEGLKTKEQMPPENVVKKSTSEDTQLSTEQLAEFANLYSVGSLFVGAAVENEIPILADLSRPPPGTPRIIRDDSMVLDEICDQYISPHEGVPVVSASNPEEYANSVKNSIRLAISPLNMMIGQSCFLKSAANFWASDDVSITANAETNQASWNSATDRINYIGRDTVDGVDALHFRADDLNMVQQVASLPEAIQPLDVTDTIPSMSWWSNLSPFASAHAATVEPKQGSGVSSRQSSGGQTVTINSIDLWLDAEHLVRLKTRTEGTVSQDGETREFFLEKQLGDYRYVPGSNLYEPYRETLRMGGIIGPEQQAEMEEAKVALEKMDRQMASMPASQRTMMENMMGSQIEQMRSLVNGGAVEVEIITTNIEINPTSFSSQSQFNPGGASGTASGTITNNSIPIGDQVEIRPYYVDEKGIGVLRYTATSGQTPHFLKISKLTNNPQRPREILVAQMGPYPGAELAIFLGSMNMLNTFYGEIEIELFQDNPYRPTVRFRPKINAARAEGMAECGAVSGNGACSN